MARKLLDAHAHELLTHPAISAVLHGSSQGFGLLVGHELVCDNRLLVGIVALPVADHYGCACQGYYHQRVGDDGAGLWKVSCCCMVCLLLAGAGGATPAAAPLRAPARWFALVVGQHAAVCGTGNVAPQPAVRSREVAARCADLTKRLRAK